MADVFVVEGATPSVEQGPASVSIGEPVEVTGGGSVPTAEGGGSTVSAPVSLAGSGHATVVGKGTATVSIGYPLEETGEGFTPSVVSGAGTVTISIDESGEASTPTVSAGTARVVIGGDEPEEGNQLLPGSTIKYGSTPTFRFELPDVWDRSNITGISVSVTDKNATELNSGDATMYAGSTLAASTDAEAISITLAPGSDALAPGDRVMIGAAGEQKEIRSVHSYDSTSLTATLDSELEFSHALGANVRGMWALYSVDMSDTTVFQNSMDIWVRFTPDSQDAASVFQYRIGTASFSSGQLWGDFEELFPTEWTLIGNKDLVAYEKSALRKMKSAFKAKGVNLDSIRDNDLILEGLLLKVREMVTFSGGNNSEIEYRRSKEAFEKWLIDTVKTEMFKDDDDDGKVDVGETTPEPDFYETERYF